MCYVFVTLYALFIFFICMDKEIIEISKCDICLLDFIKPRDR